jgi:hypothetical protein
VHFDTESCDVLLFEFTSKVALDEGGLQGMNVSDPARNFDNWVIFFSLAGGGDEEIKSMQVGQ